MNPSVAFIVISIVVLVVVAVILFLVRGKKSENKLTPLAGLAFAFILAGILFGEDRLVGYGLMGFGVLLAVVDIIRQVRRK